jgi:hypothetical protein
MLPSLPVRHFAPGSLLPLLLIVYGCGRGPAENPAPVRLPELVERAAFEKTLTLHGITFRVSCPNRGSLNELRIEPEGLTADNSPAVQEVAATVTEAEIADLDGDGSPEIYVYLQSTGSGSYGSLVAFSANELASLSGIDLPDLAEDKAASAGYQGHDHFAIAGNRLSRRFPVYLDGDANASPTGGTREVLYRLEAAPAGWALRIAEVRSEK